MAGFGPGSGSHAGARGGWSNTLTTENLMKDPGEQLSLSQSLRLGVGMAHRHLNMVSDVLPIDNRNFRRSEPVSNRQELGPLASRARETTTGQSPDAVRERQWAQQLALGNDPSGMAAGNITSIDLDRRSFNLPPSGEWQDTRSTVGMSRQRQLEMYRLGRGKPSQ